MNTGYASTTAPLMLTDFSPPNINPLLTDLTSDVPSEIHGTDPVSAAVRGFSDWYGTQPANAGGMTDSGSPWYTRIGVIALAVVLVGLGVYTVLK